MMSSAVLDASRDVADALVQADPTWRRQLVNQLATTLGADTVGLASSVNARYVDANSVNYGGPPLSADEREVLTAYWWQYPFVRRFMTTGDGTAGRNSDMVESMRSFRRTTVYGEHFGPRQARYQAGIGWHAGGVCSRDGFVPRATRLHRG